MLLACIFIFADWSWLWQRRWGQWFRTVLGLDWRTLLLNVVSVCLCMLTQLQHLILWPIVCHGYGTILFSQLYLEYGFTFLLHIILLWHLAILPNIKRQILPFYLWQRKHTYTLPITDLRIQREHTCTLAIWGWD